MKSNVLAVSFGRDSADGDASAFFSAATLIVGGVVSVRGVLPVRGVLQVGLLVVREVSVTVGVAEILSLSQMSTFGDF